MFCHCQAVTWVCKFDLLGVCVCVCMRGVRTTHACVVAFCYMRGLRRVRQCVFSSAGLLAVDQGQFGYVCEQPLLCVS